MEFPSGLSALHQRHRLPRSPVQDDTILPEHCILIYAWALIQYSSLRARQMHANRVEKRRAECELDTELEMPARRRAHSACCSTGRAGGNLQHTNTAAEIKTLLCTKWPGNYTWRDTTMKICLTFITTCWHFLFLSLTGPHTLEFSKDTSCIQSTGSHNLLSLSIHNSFFSVLQMKWNEFGSRAELLENFQAGLISIQKPDQDWFTQFYH